MPIMDGIEASNKIHAFFYDKTVQSLLSLESSKSEINNSPYGSAEN